MNSSATARRNSTGANRNASFTWTSLNSPPDTSWPLEYISQKTNAPSARIPMSR